MAHRLPSLLRNRLWCPSGGNRRDIAGHNLLGKVGIVVSAVAQLAIAVVAHGPQAAVALEKQAVVYPAAIAVTLLATICSGRLALL